MLDGQNLCAKKNAMPAPMDLTVATTAVVTVLMVLPAINRQDTVKEDVTQDIQITNATKNAL